MNSTCATAPYPGLLPNVPGRRLALASTILYPICVVLFVLVFAYKKTTVFLRKRKLPVVIFVASSALFIWSVTVLYDYLGPEYYPCWFFMLFSYLGTPAVYLPGIVVTYRYTSKVSAMRLARAVANKKRETESSNDSTTSTEIGFEAELSWNTFRSHVRVAYFGSRDDSDRIGNAKFQKV